MEQLKVKTKQYIDKDVLIAEIDSILNETNYKPFTDEVLGERKVCKDIKDFINTLEVKEEVLDKNDKTKLMQKCVHKAYKRGYDMGVLLTTNEMNHNMKEVDLEKEYERYYGQKAKAYDEALERMKSWARGEHPECFTEAQKTAEFIFPELCESKDERIRKELIEFVKSRGGFKQEYIAWLEKQGEQKPFDYENADIQQKDFAPKETVKEAESNLTPLERKVKDILFSFHINAADGISFDGTMAIVHNLITLCQQEQKPADKIKPKFKIKYAGREYNVLEIKENMGITWYGIEDEPNHIDYVKANSCEIISGYAIKENGSPYPTKIAVFSEQKPTDDDMKEALRTEYEKGRADAFAQMQKEWSEEDKDFMYDTLSNLTELKDRYGEGYVNVGKCIDWLKSLKYRCSWKPSEGQLECLGYAIEKAEKDWSPLTNNRIYLTLKVLKKQLEKL